MPLNFACTALIFFLTRAVTSLIQMAPSRLLPEPPHWIISVDPMLMWTYILMTTIGIAALLLLGFALTLLYMVREEFTDKDVDRVNVRRSVY